MRRRWLVSLIAALQFGVPGVMLVERWITEGSRPEGERHFSWQMYSASPSPIYTGIDREGRPRPLSPAGEPILVRSIHYGSTLVERLCDANPELQAVWRTQRTRGESRTYKC